MVALTQLSKWLEQTQTTKVLSVYIAPRSTNPADRFGWSSRLQRRLTEMELELRAAGRSSEEWELRAAAVTLRKALADLDISNAPGFAAFVVPGRVLYAERTSAPTPDLVIWAEGIHVAPLLAASTSEEPVVIAVVSSREATIYRHENGGLRRDDRVHTGHHEGQFYHMGSAAKQGFHSGTRGETGTDAAQRVQRGAAMHMVRELAERVEKLAGADAAIVIGGTPDAARQAFDALSPSAMLRAEVAPDLPVSADEPTIARVALRVAGELRGEMEQTHIAEATDLAAAHGKAAVGVQPVRDALAASAVHQLYISPTFISTRMEEAEELVRHAIAESAKMVVAEGVAVEALDAIGGVAARLRFVPALVS